MLRQFAAPLAAAALAASPSLDVATPAPADLLTAARVLGVGSGTHRLALWKAANARGELCVGWTVAASAAPARFTCLRRGLERPLLTVEAAGGFGGQTTWGVLAGLASPAVTRVSAETLYGSATTRDLALRPVPSLRGWRSFTTGMLDHPSSTTLAAYDSNGNRIVEVSGAAIHPTAPPSQPVVVTPPPVNGQAPPPSGPPWSDTAATLGETAADEPAITAALADATVRTLVSVHSAWIDGVSAWYACGGRQLGSVLSFRFAASASFVATLPSVGRPSGASAYAVTIRKLAVTGSHGLSVWVDSRLRAVVGVDPAGLPDGGTALPLLTVSGPHDQGGPDTPSCWQSHA